MHITPDEAARALAEVRRTQRMAMRSAPPMFPAWYLIAVWGVVTAIQLVTEFLAGPAVPIGVTLLAIGLAAAVAKFVGDVRVLAVRPHRSLIDPWGWVGLAAWIIGGQLLCFTLLALFRAADFGYPRTAATLPVFVLVVVTAPLLPRWMTMRNARRAEALQAAADPARTGPITR